MMKFKLPLISSLLVVVLFISCDKTETFDEQWKEANEQMFALIYDDSQYHEIKSFTNWGSIMYKEIESGYGATPFFTDKVKVLYTGWFKYDWTKPDTYQDNKGNVIYNKKVFDTTSNNNIPRKMVVNEFIDGLITALQHMQVGDKWEVWIPWQLGYYDVGSGSIPGHTTLVFEIELVEVIE